MTNVHRATPIRRISKGVDDRGDQQVYPIAFSVRGWTSVFFVSICSCLAHMYIEKQGWTHFTLFINFLICCFKLCNHLHTINYDIWLLSTTTPLFFTSSSVPCFCSRSSPWSKPF